jgi:hypothetical protein
MNIYIVLGAKMNSKVSNETHVINEKSLILTVK